MLVSLLVALISFPFNILHWMKWSLAFAAIRIHKATRSKRFGLYDANAEGDAEKCGFLAPQLEADLESPQSEIHLKESADEILFYGVNSKAECLLVRVTRGINQEAEAWIYLKLADGTRYHLADHVHYQQSFEGKCTIFSCGNLQMRFMLPMRRWRIQYCGPLVWSVLLPMSMIQPLAHTDFAEAVARSKWNSYLTPSTRGTIEALNFYSQMGTLRGTISVDEDTDFYELNLFGEKIRNLGNSSSISGCIFETVLGYVPLTGFGIHLIKASVPKLFKNLPCGFAIKPDGDIDVLRNLEIKRKPLDGENNKQVLSIHFTTGRFIINQNQHLNQLYGRCIQKLYL